MGSWLEINGEAMYESKAWKFQNDTRNPDVWYTMNKNTNDIYGTLLKWSPETIEFGAVRDFKFDGIQLLGYAHQLDWFLTDTSVIVNSTGINRDNQLKWAWTFKFLNVR